MLADLLYTVNAVMPIILMVAIGYFMKKGGILNDGAVACINKLVFRLLLPIMLFVNVYKVENIAAVDMTYILFVIVVILLLALVAMLLVGRLTAEPSRRSILVQSAFRSNFALIGIPLATSLFGAEGAIIATLLSAVTIPLFNILAVISFAIYSGESKQRIDIPKILKGIVTNPLIIGVALGVFAQLIRMLFLRLGVGFRLSDVGFLYDGVLLKLSATATPIALLALGAEFEFSAIGSMKREIIAGTAARCLIAPIVGVGLALLIGSYEGAHFAAFISVFGTPLAVSTVPMAQQMDADHTLAGQLVVWTTLLSAVTLFVGIYILRSIGIF